jgi:hypothetical protein
MLQGYTDGLQQSQSSVCFPQRFAFGPVLQCDANEAFILALVDQEETDPVIAYVF